MSITLQHTVSVRVLIPQLVKCVHCNTEFIYEMKRTGAGMVESGLVFGKQTAREAAEKIARQNLEAKLKDPEACDPVPCPKCLLFQPYMRAVSARRKYSQMPVLGGLVLFFAALLVGVAIINWQMPDGSKAGGTQVTVIAGVGAALALGLGIAIFVLHKKLVAGHDPNAMAEPKRQQLADERSKLPDQFREYHEKRTHKTYREYRRDLKRNATRQPRGSEPPPFVVDLWLPPSVIIDGGTISVRLPTGEEASVQLPEDGMPGSVYPVEVPPGLPHTFAVRTLAFRIHPGELPDDE